MSSHKGNKHELLVISNDDCAACDGYNIDVIEQVIRESFLQLASGECYLPHKTVLKPPFSQAQMNVMPCALKRPSGTLFGTKILVRDQTNLARGYPNVNAATVIFDEDTKQLAAIINGDMLSACRTGAATRVMARYILTGTIDTVLLLGAGSVMKQQLIAIKPFLDSNSKIIVFSRGDSKYAFAESMGAATEGSLSTVNNLDHDLISSSDVIIGCIPNKDISKSPIKKATLKKGVTFFNIGLYDMDIDTVCSFDRYVTDSWSDVRVRGEVAMVDAFEKDLISENDIVEFLPYIQSNQMIRNHKEEKLLLSAVGFGCHDVLLGKYIYDQCEKRNIGKHILMSY